MHPWRGDPRRVCFWRGKPRPMRPWRGKPRPVRPWRGKPRPVRPWRGDPRRVCFCRDKPRRGALRALVNHGRRALGERPYGDYLACVCRWGVFTGTLRQRLRFSDLKYHRNVNDFEKKRGKHDSTDQQRAHPVRHRVIAAWRAQLRHQLALAERPHHLLGRAD